MTNPNSFGNSEEQEETPPTFGEMLLLAAKGEMLFYTVFGDDGIGYAFSDVDEPLEPESPNETIVPMSAEDAKDMYDELEETDELDELGKPRGTDNSGLN